MNGGLLGEDLSLGLGSDNSGEAHYFLYMAKIRELIDLREICFPSPLPLIYTHSL